MADKMAKARKSKYKDTKQGGRDQRERFGGKKKKSKKPWLVIQVFTWREKWGLGPSITKHRTREHAEAYMAKQLRSYSWVHPEHFEIKHEEDYDRN